MSTTSHNVRVHTVTETLDALEDGVRWEIQTTSGLSFTLDSDPHLHVGDTIKISVEVVATAS